MRLPKQDCPLGYTKPQIEEIMAGRLAEFYRWMRGQTVTACEGRKYNHEAKQYEPDDCAGDPHGMIVYTWDAERFLRGLPIID